MAAATPVSKPTAGDASPGAPGNAVTVFGASWAKPGSELYAEAEKLGKLLAEAGFAVRNGGYSGTMEAVSKGVAEAGGHVTGFVVSQTFLNREGGNEHLSHAVDAPNLIRRIEGLTVGVNIFVALKGTLGTLTELVVAWNHSHLSGLGEYKTPLILAYEDPWKGVCEHCAAALELSDETLQAITFVSSAEEVVTKALEYAAQGRE